MNLTRQNSPYLLSTDIIVSYQWLLQIDLLGHGKPMDQFLPYKRDKHKRKLRKIE
jgi:hypothetical protein